MRTLWSRTKTKAHLRLRLPPPAAGAPRPVAEAADAAPDGVLLVEGQLQGAGLSVVAPVLVVVVRLRLQGAAVVQQVLGQRVGLGPAAGQGEGGVGLVVVRRRAFLQRRGVQRRGQGGSVLLLPARRDVGKKTLPCIINPNTAFDAQIKIKS